MQALQNSKPSMPAGLAPPSDGIVRSWIGDRRVLAAAGLALTGAGVALGWDWLSAIGLAPVILSAGPCLLMCALGLCMMGKGNQACSNQSSPPPGEPSTESNPPSQREP